MARGKDEVIGRTYLVYCALAVSREEVERIGVRAAGVSRMKHHCNSRFASFRFLPKLKKGVTFKIDVPFLTNTSPIRENDVLMLPAEEV